MKKVKRVFLTVLDSFGIGGAKDAEAFGDAGSFTLGSVARSSEFSAGNLRSAGLFNIDGLDAFGPTGHPWAAYARMEEASLGKDTTTGHWEIAGLISQKPMPTFPDGFPGEVLEKFRKISGRGVLCNRPYSGTDVIRDFGEEHLRTGDLIVYTSADSVFQIAAHESVLPPEELYDLCRRTRAMLTGDFAVGRVIARPFVGNAKDGFTRTAKRRDFSLEPTGATLLDELSAGGLEVLSVGKIYDIFASRGITDYVLTHGNTEGMEEMLNMQKRDFHGLCFTNLVDFDMLYGHRNDADGYASALAEFDAFLPVFRAGMREGDVWMITADHGCDPGDLSTDHTRENVPLLILGKDVLPVNLGTRHSFADIAATVAEWLGVGHTGAGESFAREVIGE